MKRRKTNNIEHERLTSLINSMADGVIAVDESLKVAVYNGAALNILDINTSISGYKLTEILKPVDKNNQVVDISKLIRNTRTSNFSRDLKLHYADDSYINLYMSIAPVHLGYGKSGNRGYVILIRDITHEKSLEEERDEFISVVSHELRTPIAITEGNISNAQFVANKVKADKGIIQALDEAHKQVLFLSDMINDLSTLSRAERGKLAFETETIDIVDLAHELADNYMPQATEKGLKLKLDVDKCRPLNSGKLYVREVLQNFLTNAIKYTEKGSVTIGAKNNPKGTTFWISDTGIGISHSDQEKIFDKFFRSEDYRTRQTSGTGLGLYVTTKLADLLHAEIDVKSKLNKGSTFTVFFPDLG